MTSSPHDHADDGDLAEQQTAVGEDEDAPDVHHRDDADEGDLLEQAMPVPEDDDDHRA